MRDAIESLSRRIRNLIVRGAVTNAALTPKRTIVQVSGLAGDATGGLELFLPYGMSALPLPGGDILRNQILGNADHLVALFCDDSSLRIADLQPGEFGFRDSNGQQVVFRQDRIEVTTPLKLVANVTGDCDLTVGGNVNLAVTGNITSSAAEWNHTGPLNVTGSIVATETVQGATVQDGTRSMAADRAKYDAHTHPGVTSGSANTGTPSVTE